MTDAWGGSWGTSWGESWFGAQAPTPPAVPVARGGDDAPGWSHKRATLKRKKDDELTASIRGMYRELTAAPQTRERAVEIVAPIVEPVQAQGETQEAYLEALSRRAEALRAERIRLDRITTDGEIALRLLYQELRELQELDDERAIEALLAQVL